MTITEIIAAKEQGLLAADEAIEIIKKFVRLQMELLESQIASIDRATL